MLNNIKHNVHDVEGRPVVRVQADIDKEIYDYFFHNVIAYTHGSRQAMITWFFQCFYEECLRRGIQKVWDEDNGEKLVGILNNMNFVDQTTVSVKRKRKDHK
jgi:hypothetical protein